MKKVLILEGSARANGNSCALSEEFARGAAEAGYSVEKIMVARKKLSGCLGCNACYRNGGTCGAPDTAFTETMLASLRGFTCCVPEAKEGGVVLGVGAMEAGEIRTSPAMQQAYQLGKNV